MEAGNKDRFIRLLNKDFSRLDKLTLSSEYLHKVSEISEYNDLIASYYVRMSEENGMLVKDLYARTAENVSKCHKLYFSDYYPLLQTKDVLSIPMCKNRFCANCQKLLQQKRVNAFKPFIDSALNEGYNLYHVVFTVKNPSAAELEENKLRSTDNVADPAMMFPAQYKKHLQCLCGICRVTLRLVERTCGVGAFTRQSEG